MVYNMVYKLPKNGSSYIKRFTVAGVTRDRKYSLTAEIENCKVLYFTVNPNGEAEVITVLLRQTGSIKKLKWDLDFADVLIKGRASKGNLVSAGRKISSASPKTYSFQSSAKISVITVLSF